jgi:hypothetical protein
MGVLLLHNPWVHFYLLHVAALWAVFLVSCLQSPSVRRDGTPTPPKEAAKR